MPDPLRVLILEDQEFDADLMRQEVLRAWPEALFRRAQTRDEFVAGLLEFLPHVVLSDHALPLYTGSEALALSQSLSPETPFVMVTGSLDEETAVECIKGGAADYVLKENLRRLVPAIRRALTQARERRAREQAYQALKASAERYRQVFDKNPHPVFVTDADTLRILDANEAALSRYGYDRDELLRLTTADLVHPEDVVAWRDFMSHHEMGLAFGGTWRHRTREGELRYVELAGRDIAWGDHPALLLLAVDVTERRKLGEAIEEARR